MPHDEHYGNSVLGGYRVVRLPPGPAAADVVAQLQGDDRVAAATHIYHTPNCPEPWVPTGELLLVLARDLPAEEAQEIRQRFGLEFRREGPLRGSVVAPEDVKIDTVDLCSKLQRLDGVEVAEPDLAVRLQLHAAAAKLDSFLAAEWHLENVGTLGGSPIGMTKGADARVVAAWNKLGSKGDEGVLVAVLDDGFDLGHPDLAGKSLAAYDFSRRLPDVSPTAADVHGTPCAGLAVAKVGGGMIIGVAPGCTLMPLRIHADLSDKNVAEWFDYLVGEGAWVASCSWGSPCKYFPLSTTKEDAITKAAKSGRGGKGCVICFSVGNDNRDINDPPGGSVNGFANHPLVIAVAATTSLDTRATYSNFGSTVSVAAPGGGGGGVTITTTDIQGTAGMDSGDYTPSFSGTSAACPIVAGVCALLLSQDPSLTAADVKKRLENTAVKLHGTSGHSPYFGYGRVDAEKAL